MNDLDILKGQKVAPAFAHLKVNQNLAEGINVGGFPTVRYRAKVWSLRCQGQDYNFVREDDGTQSTFIDVIILGASPFISKEYYPEWDDDVGGAPVCYSTKGDAPDPGCSQPQSKTCGVCKLGEWTTLPTGRQGKKCRDVKRMAVLLMPNHTIKMLGAPLLEPVFIKIPPGSFKSLKTYNDMLIHSGFPPSSVVTRMSFDSKQLFQMNFKVLQVLTDKEAPMVLPLVNDPQTKRILGEQPEMYEVQEAAPVEEHKPIKTGLLEAFGGNGGAQPVQQPELFTPPPSPPAQEKRGRGRPPKSKLEAIVDVTPPAEAPKPVTPWVDGDTDLDREVAALLDKSVSNMLK